jgi:hypothetical protein
MHEIYTVREKGSACADGGAQCATHGGLMHRLDLVNRSAHTNGRGNFKVSGGVLGYVPCTRSDWHGCILTWLTAEYWEP